MNVENTSYLLKNLGANTSLTENLTVDSNNITNITKETDKWNLIFMTELYGTPVTTSLGVFTNILVVATLIVSWKFWRHSLGILLLTLACVDIIGNGVCFIYYLLAIFQNLFFPQTFYYLNNGFKRLSYLMMIPISANRYALICKPFTHHVITSTKSTLIQITTLAVFALSSGIFELYLNQITKSLYSICNLIINAVMCSILPLIVTFVLTVLVICEFRRMNRTLGDSVRTGANSRQGERNVARAMIAVNVAFIVLILPQAVFRIIWIFFKLENNSDYSLALIWLTFLSDLNFSVNIFIYTLCLPRFRSTLLGLFAYKCCRKRETESVAMSVL